MAGLHDMAKMSVSGTPGTGTITLASAISGYQTFAAAGAVNGEVVSYSILDGTNWEVGRGTYTASGTTLSRGPLYSNNANAAINASSGAVVWIAPLAEDFYIAQMQDAAITAPTDNDFLAYHAATLKWTNRTHTAATALFDAMVGDSGSGGTKGLAPAPAAGDTAAGKFLKADGTWEVPPGGALRVPQRTVFTSGTGTYTTPTGALYLEVELIGGGGGGAGANGSEAPAPTPGSDGGSTTFGISLLAATGGAGGANGGVGGVGGEASGGDINIGGQQGAAGTSSQLDVCNGLSGAGANSFFGGSGQGNAQNLAGSKAQTNSGSGGGGAGSSDSITSDAGGGGGAGGYCRKLITSPAASYAYAVGAGGAGGAPSGGSLPNNGGNGAAGLIVVTAYFQ